MERAYSSAPAPNAIMVDRNRSETSTVMPTLVWGGCSVQICSVQGETAGFRVPLKTSTLKPELWTPFPPRNVFGSMNSCGCCVFTLRFEGLEFRFGVEGFRIGFEGVYSAPIGSDTALRIPQNIPQAMRFSLSP